MTDIMYTKEVALVGTNCKVFADILGAMLADGMSVSAMVDFPERVMIEDSRLTVGHFDFDNYDRMKESFEGYHDVVLTYNDDLEDQYTNDLTLRSFSKTVAAAREAGVARIVVVGSPDSEAFFVTDLRRMDGIDWVFVSTEGDFAGRVAEEVAEPSYHREVFVE